MSWTDVCGWPTLLWAKERENQEQWQSDNSMRKDAYSAHNGMVYGQQSQRSHFNQSSPAAPPIPTSNDKVRRPSHRSSLARPSSKGSIATVASGKSRNGVGSRRPTIGPPSGFRKVEGVPGSTGTLDSGNGDVKATIPKPPPAALAPPFQPLELQIHKNGRCLSPMPTFARGPSLQHLPPTRSSSLPDSKLSQGPEFAPIPVRPSSVHDTDKELAVFAEEAPKARQAPMSKLEAEIIHLDDESEAVMEQRDEIQVELVPEKRRATRSQSYYAHEGTLLLVDTLDVPPPVPHKNWIAMPSPNPESSEPWQQQPKQFPLQPVDTHGNDHKAILHKSRSMPKLSTKSRKSSSLTASPVEMDAKDEYLRIRTQRQLVQSRVRKSESNSEKSASTKIHELASPVSPTSESRSRSNSASKTIATVTESERNSAFSFNSMASETSISSLNSGNITNEKYVRAKNTEFEMLKPMSIDRRISSRSTNAPVPISGPRHSPSVPALRVQARPQLTSSHSTEHLAPSMQVPKPTVRRSKTIQDSPSMSPGLERFGGTFGWGQVVKGSPRLVTVGEKEIRKVDNRVEWGKGLGVEWGVVY